MSLAYSPIHAQMQLQTRHSCWDYNAAALASEEEHARRLEMWQKLLAAGGPNSVHPILLRELRIYGGSQGVWVDKVHTARATGTAAGATVGALHTGSHYA